MKDEKKKSKNASGNLNYTKSEYLKFLIPSLIALFFFIIPVKFNGNWTIMYGIVSDFIGEILRPFLDYPLLITILAASTMTLIGTYLKPDFIMKNDILRGFFVTSNVFAALRVIGGVFSIIILFQIGPEIIWGVLTGGTMWSLASVLAVWFILASFLMPLLTDFGLMDFAGAVFRKVTRPVFTLPGRSTVDLLASWLGSGTVGAQLTVKQYEAGYYTGREAAAIATCFSAVSISYSLVVAKMMNLEHIFFPFYLSLTLAGAIASIICARIYPLKNIPDTFIDEDKIFVEDVPEGYTTLQWANQTAVEKARVSPTVKDLFLDGILGFANIMLTLIPVVIAVGTLALMIVEFTPIFDIASLPMGYLLKLLKIEEAFAVAPATLTGFADMLLPPILLQNVVSEKTRFIIGGMSLMQVIYMSENGSLILQSKIPMGLKELFIVFLQRTLVGILIMTLIANVIY